LLPTAILQGIRIWDKENRGKGYAKQAMNKYIDFALSNNCHSCMLTLDKMEDQLENFDLENWYRSFGFETVESESNYPLMILEL
jgi:GNAT superfamily N-acetyltransferase